MKKNYTLRFEAWNKPGVLYRITGIFLRRKINVERLEAKPTDKEGISEGTFVIYTDEINIQKVLQQIKHVVEVEKAEIL